MQYKCCDAVSDSIEAVKERDFLIFLAIKDFVTFLSFVSCDTLKNAEVLSDMFQKPFCNRGKHLVLFPDQV